MPASEPVHREQHLHAPPAFAARAPRTPPPVTEGERDMPRSLSRANCALASSLHAGRPAEPLAKRNAQAKRRRQQRRAACRTVRRGATRRTNAGGRRR